jgi:two-component system cell cycle response regulator CtrA
MRILFVEPDAAETQFLSPLFDRNGIIADPAESAEDALELARHYDYDLILLEATLPDMDGIELVRRLRVARIQTPVLILSSAWRPESRVRAFGVGADDVVQKPFDRAELVARMQAVIRRSKGFSGSCLTVGNLVLKQDSREVTVDGRDVRLTGKEYAILELLVLRKGMVLTKDAFLNHLYGGMDEPEAKIIDVFICKLRKKLGVAGGCDLIGTVWGRGYMMRDPNSPAALSAASLQAPENLIAAA